jgi:hypothetical protein
MDRGGEVEGFPRGDNFRENNLSPPKNLPDNDPALLVEGRQPVTLV